MKVHVVAAKWKNGHLIELETLTVAPLQRHSSTLSFHMAKMVN